MPITVWAPDESKMTRYISSCDRWLGHIEWKSSKLIFPTTRRPAKLKRVAVKHYETVRKLTFPKQLETQRSTWANRFERSLLQLSHLSRNSIIKLIFQLELQFLTHIRYSFNLGIRCLRLSISLSIYLFRNCVWHLPRISLQLALRCSYMIWQKTSFIHTV